MQSQSTFNPLTPHFTVLDIWRGLGTKHYSNIRVKCADSLEQANNEAAVENDGRQGAAGHGGDGAAQNQGRRSVPGTGDHPSDVLLAHQSGGHLA